MEVTFYLLLKRGWGGGNRLGSFHAVNISMMVLLRCL